MSLDPVILLKIFYIILMNEGFFKECMRQYHIMHIRALRKTHISEHFKQANIEDIKLKEEYWAIELKSSQSKLDSLRLEFDAAQQRHIQNEARLQRKIAELLLDGEAKVRIQAELEMRVEDFEVKNKDLQNQLNDSLELSKQLEFKIRDLQPQLRRLDELERETAERNEQKIHTLPPKPDHSERYQVKIAQLTNSLEYAEEQLEFTKQALE